MRKKSIRPSLRAAINANCKDCVFDSTESGTWRKQVENCPVKACSLYPVRPVSVGGVK